VHGTAVTKPVTQAVVGLGKCVDVRGGETKNGTAVQLYTCNQGAAQTWARSGTTFQALGGCLDVKKSGTKNRTKVQLWGCNGSAAQDWTAGEQGSLVNTRSGRCLDIPQGISKKRVQLQIYRCNGSDAQRWSLEG
jgi:hypothetical protein